MTNNTKLTKAFEKAYSLGRALPEGTETKTLTDLTKEYAESMKISCTPDEISATVSNGLEEMSKTEINNLYECRM